MILTKNNTSSIIWGDPLYAIKGEPFAVFCQKLKLALEGKVEACYIFGSFATGENTVESDIDIIIITDTKNSFTERTHLFPEVYDLTNKVDLLIYTPEELAHLLNKEENGFWALVKKTMIRVV